MYGPTNELDSNVHGAGSGGTYATVCGGGHRRKADALLCLFFFPGPDRHEISRDGFSRRVCEWSTRVQGNVAF
jgi:hypothetical protein